jgi:hypothetical protein
MRKKTEKFNSVINKSKNLIHLCAFVLMFFICGCEALRFVPSETQKQNAWLHNRTAAVTADAVENECASEKLQALARLSELQSRAFVSYCGLPKEFPQAETTEDILRDNNIQLARSAISESTDRPDTWQVADSAVELAIGISALFGGVYGTRAVRFLKDARAKSQALKEIIDGNEFFKEQNESSVSAFKDAHRNQSSITRQIVTQMKA